MPFIQNVGRGEIIKGFHYDPGPNSMLIQISDPPGDHPTPMYQFKEVYKFDFLDIEEDGMTNNGDGSWTDMSEFAITDGQATELVRVLQHALTNHMNVIVHCTMGVCRSGAVCEVGIMMGFDDTETYRSPNLLVKHKMMKSLGWGFDEDEPQTINGVAIPKEWKNDGEKIPSMPVGKRKRNEEDLND